MALKIIQDEIARFLSTSEAEVLAMRGSWGVGKTFAWNKMLADNKDKIALGKYAYVSLFGINAISALEECIFRQRINKTDIGNTPDIHTFRENIADLMDGFEVKKNTAQFFSTCWNWLKQGN